MIPLADKLLGLLIGTIICAVFGIVIYIFVKKHNKKTVERIDRLTEQQKDILKNASINKSNITKGLICEEPKVGKLKTQLDVLFYNMYYPNTMKRFISVHITISSKEFNDFLFKQGDYVDIILDENGAKIHI